MLREEKVQFVEQMKADLAEAQSVLFLDFTGLTVAEADSLRGKMREAQVKYQVVKNTLMKRVLAGTPFERASDCLKGSPTGVAVGIDDPAAAARIAYQFLKECAHLKVKGGIVENKAITVEEAEALSKLPSRSEMQAQVVGLVLGVAGQLIAQIQSPGGRIVGALETKAKEGEAA